MTEEMLMSNIEKHREIHFLCGAYLDHLECELGQVDIPPLFQFERNLGRGCNLKRPFNLYQFWQGQRAHVSIISPKKALVLK